MKTHDARDTTNNRNNGGVRKATHITPASRDGTDSIPRRGNVCYTQVGVRDGQMSPRKREREIDDSEKFSDKLSRAAVSKSNSSDSNKRSRRKEETACVNGQADGISGLKIRTCATRRRVDRNNRLVEKEVRHARAMCQKCAIS